MHEPPGWQLAVSLVFVVVSVSLVFVVVCSWSCLYHVCSWSCVRGRVFVVVSITYIHRLAFDERSNNPKP